MVNNILAKCWPDLVLHTVQTVPGAAPGQAVVMETGGKLVASAGADEEEDDELQDRSRSPSPMRVFAGPIIK